MAWVVCTEKPEPDWVLGVDYRLIAGHALASMDCCLLLNEESGSVAYDSSGNGHHASLIGSAAWVSAGVSVKRTAPVGYLKNTTLPARTNTDSWSVIGVVDAVSGTDHTLVGGRSSGASGWKCSLRVYDNTYMAYSAIGVADHRLTSLPAPNGRTFVGFVKSGSNLTAYRDDSSQTVAVANMKNSWEWLSGLHIGAACVNSAESAVMTGTIEHFYFYPFALTSTQMADLRSNPWHMFERWVEDEPQATRRIFRSPVFDSRIITAGGGPLWTPIS